MCKLKEKDEKILELLISHDAVVTAIEVGYASPNSLYQRLFRLRKHREESQIFINKLNAFANRSARLKKFLISGRIKDLEE